MGGQFNPSLIFSKTPNCSFYLAGGWITFSCPRTLWLYAHIGGKQRNKWHFEISWGWTYFGEQNLHVKDSNVGLL